MSVALTCCIDFLTVSISVKLLLEEKEEEEGASFLFLPNDDVVMAAASSSHDCKMSGSNSKCTSRYRFFWRTILFIRGLQRYYGLRDGRKLMLDKIALGSLLFASGLVEAIEEERRAERGREGDS